MESQTKEIKDKNRLIAEFLGLTPDDKGWFDGHELSSVGLPFAYGAMGNGTYELKFHSSWDWLMFAADKCMSCLENSNFMDNIKAEILQSDLQNDISSIDIGRAYARLVEVCEFIQDNIK